MTKSITIDDYEIKDSKLFDITQVDFDELKERFFSPDSKKTTLEKLRSAIKRKIKELMDKNPSNESYHERFEELINAYNSGDIDAEKLFLEMMSLSRDLGEEETRYIREGLTEEELVIFDILTRPEPKLSKSEIEKVKLVAKELLDKLKKERLVIDWKKKQATRAKVANAIQDICEELPEEPYTIDIYKHKCDELYNYVYDNYSGNEIRV